MIGSLAALAISSLTLGQTATYGVRQVGGAWWLTDPAGKPFWSLGVCCVDPGVPWSEWKNENRGYAAYRLFDNGKLWVQAVQSQLDSLGFNTLGGWSEIDLFRKYGATGRKPYFVVLHLGAYYNAPHSDMFGKEMQGWIDRAARDQIPKVVNDPYLIGYFSDNELGWWADTIFLTYLSMPAASPGRIRLFQTMKQHYGSNFARFKKDWDTTASTFEALPKAKLTLREGGSGMAFIEKWTGIVADKYYSTVRAAIRRHDPRRMICGDRYIQFYSLPVVKASTKYVDVVSTNKGADWNNGDYSRFYFDTLYRITKKPIVVTEFYVGADQNRSGNINNGDSFPKVRTQEERARVFKRCVEFFAGHPAIVGAHWFQYSDEPEHGRDDGENWNMGLVDIHGKLYEELASAARSLDVRKRHAAAAGFPGVKVVPAAPTSATTSLRDWDKERGFVKPTSGLAHADLYVAQDHSAVYFGLYASDYMDERIYAGGKVPEGERSEFKLSIAGGPKVSVRFGGKDRKASGAPGSVEVFEKPNLRFTIILRVPKHSLTRGSKLAFSAEAVTHSRGNRVGWKAEATLK